jgi:hypothetical protein
MTLRMQPVSAERWAQLAASRHPVDLVDEPTPRPRPDVVRRRQADFAAIQAEVAAIAAQRVSAIR